MRSVEEALKSCIKWREDSRRNFTMLKESGEFVENEIQISKKTLDDYWFQFKKGIVLDYDFTSAMLESRDMSDLRKFIKNSSVDQKKLLSEIKQGKQWYLEMLKKMYTEFQAKKQSLQ